MPYHVNRPIDVSVQPSTTDPDSAFSRYLDTVGDGSGTKDSAVDHSGAAEEYLIKPPSGSRFVVTHLDLIVSVSGKLSHSLYGADVTLTNGIKIDVRDSGGTALRELHDALPIKTNAHMARHLEGGWIPCLAPDIDSDGETRALETVDYEHHEIHGGTHYYVAGHETENAAGTIDFVAVTPNTAERVHIRFEIYSTDDINVDFYEGSTYTGGTGAAVTPINNERNSANTSNLTVIKDPTVTGLGTALLATYSGDRNVPALVDQRDEFVLAQNTIYLWRITASNNGTEISYKGSWYEHTKSATCYRGTWRMPGTGILLDGSLGNYLAAVLNDDFSDLGGQWWIARGYVLD